MKNLLRIVGAGILLLLATIIEAGDDEFGQIIIAPFFFIMSTALVFPFFGHMRYLGTMLWEKCWAFIKKISYAIDKKDRERYCEVCRAKKHSLGRVSFMIRTGTRVGSDETEQMNFSERSILVCERHHPDSDVLGADLAEETQAFLRKNGESARCVYFYIENRQ